MSRLSVNRMLRINKRLLDNNMQPTLPSSSPISLEGANDPALKLVQEAANGGDYRALFQGRKLEFRLSSIAKDIVQDEVDITNDEYFRDDQTSKLTLLGRLIKEGKVAEIKKVFIEWVAETKSGIVNAIDKICRITIGPISFLEAMEMLSSLVPSFFVNFVGKLIKSILPFVGQILAVGEAIADIAEYVIVSTANPKLQHAATRVNASTIFNREARNCCMALVGEELSSKRNDAILSSASAVVSVTGLVLTGNVVSMVSGMAVSIAKLLAQVKEYFELFASRRNGNAELQKLAANPCLVHPNSLFAAAPILGAYYMAFVSDSSIMSFSEAKLFRFGSPEWTAECERVRKELAPLRAKARKFASESLLVLR